MNKKLARKYLEMTANDSGFGHLPKNTPHECHAEKRKCPLRQQEFNFGGDDSNRSSDYAKYLKDFEAWAMRQRNPDVLSEAMRKYGDNDDIAEIISKAGKALFMIKAEEYFTELGERL